jgi:hypothetical protein
MPSLASSVLPSAQWTTCEQHRLLNLSVQKALFPSGMHLTKFDMQHCRPKMFAPKISLPSSNSFPASLCLVSLACSILIGCSMLIGMAWVSMFYGVKNRVLNSDLPSSLFSIRYDLPSETSKVTFIPLKKLLAIQ